MYCITGGNMLSSGLLCRFASRGGDGSNFMDTDHLSPADDTTDTIRLSKIIMPEVSFTRQYQLPSCGGSLSYWAAAFGRWYEGKLLAKNIFQ